MYSGRQPASTALIATFSAVMVRRRVVSVSTTSPGAQPTAARNGRTASAVAGTTGRPSVQPRSKYASTASVHPATATSAAARGMTSSFGKNTSTLRSCPYETAPPVRATGAVGLDYASQTDASTAGSARHHLQQARAAPARCSPPPSPARPPA